MFTLGPAIRQLLMCGAAAAMLLATVAGCKSAVQVQHQHAEDLYHGGYRTYGLLEHPVGRAAGVDEIIEASIHETMAAKGYTREDPKSADLLVSYKVLIHGEVAPVGPLANADLGGTWFNDPTRERQEPEPNAVWVAAPPVDGSRLARDARDKTVLVLLQESESFHVVWLGWSLAEVSPSDLASTTKHAISEIMERVPDAAGTPSAGTP